MCVVLQVYQGIHEKTAKRVAVKVLPPVFSTVATL